MKYTLRENSAFHKEDAQSIGERIEFLLKQRNGKLTPEDVVEDSKSSSSIFSKYINWNTKDAAHKYRLQQARGLIRSVNIVVEEIDAKPLVSAFVNVKSKKERKHYVAIKTAMNDQTYYAQLVNDARQEVEMWYTKYSLYPALREVMEDIEEPIEMIKRKLRL